MPITAGLKLGNDVSRTWICSSDAQEGAAPSAWQGQGQVPRATKDPPRKRVCPAPRAPHALRAEMWHGPPRALQHRALQHRALPGWQPTSRAQASKGGPP